MTSAMANGGFSTLPTFSSSGFNTMGGQTQLLDNGYGKGPRRQKWGIEAGTRAVQGEVTLNVFVYRELFRDRRTATESKPRASRLGSVTKTDDVDIHEHDLVFAFKTQSVRRGGGGGAATGFSSFSGIDISLFPTQDAFEDSFRCLGRAKAPYNFDDPEQGNNAIAVQVRGAQTIANRGEHEFFPGDVIAWRLPALDPAQRERDTRYTHSPEGFPKDKAVPYLVRKTYADIYRLPERAFQRYQQVRAQQHGEQLVRARQISRSPTAPADNLTRLAIGMFRVPGMTHLLAGLAVLQARGLVTLNVTPQWQNRQDYADALRRAAAPRDEVDASMDARTRRENADRIVTFAYMLDLLTPRARDAYLAPSDELVQDVLMTQNAGVHATAADRARYSLGTFASASTGATADAGQYNPAVQLDRVHVNAARRAMRLYGEASERINEKTVGRALSHSMPGEMVDVLM